MKTTFFFLLLFTIVQSSFAQTDSLIKLEIIKDLESLTLSNENDTANYIIGMIFSKQLESLPKVITENDMILLKGFLAGQQEKGLFTFEEANGILMEIIAPPPASVEDAVEAEAVEEVIEEEVKPVQSRAKMSPEEMVFFVKNGKREGVKTTSNGIQYELILGSGRGGSPTLNDKINFFYFANYQKDEETIKVEKEGYANLKYQDIKWQGIYQLLKVGNTYRFYLPSVYADRAPDVFADKGEMIIVDIELMKITEPYNYEDEGGY